MVTLQLDEIPQWFWRSFIPNGVAVEDDPWVPLDYQIVDHTRRRRGLGSPRLGAKLNSELRDTRFFRINGEPPRPIDGALLHEIESLVKFQQRWFARKLNRDIQSCRPCLDRISIVSPTVFPQGLHELDRVLGISCGLTREIVLCAQSSGSYVLANCNRHLVALLGRQTVQLFPHPTKSWTIFAAATGFHNLRTHAFQWINDAVVELLSLEVLAAYSARVNRHQPANTPHAFQIQAAFLATLVADAERRLRLPSGKLRKDIYRAYLDGEFRVWRFVDRLYGRGTLAQISSPEQKTDYRSLKLLLADVLKIDPRSFKALCEEYLSDREIEPSEQISTPATESPDLTFANSY